VQRKGGNGFKIAGAPTEGALLVLSEKIGVPDEKANGANFSNDDPEFRKDVAFNYWKRKYGGKAVKTLEFSRERKSMSVIVKGEDGVHWLFAKGASEFDKENQNTVLARCTTIRDGRGQIVPLEEDVKIKINNVIVRYAKKGLRVLGLAALRNPDMKQNFDELKEYPKARALLHSLTTRLLHCLCVWVLTDRLACAAVLCVRLPYSSMQIESGMTFIGLVAMMDPPRADVAASIEKCKRANIGVIVITGDNKDTAVAICRSIGVFTEHEDVSHRAFLGADFASMTADAQIRAIKDAALFSRVEPRHKRELVELLKSQGHVRNTHTHTRSPPQLEN
jgi:P-type Ca2+ transporter type 2A